MTYLSALETWASARSKCKLCNGQCWGTEPDPPRPRTAPCASGIAAEAGETDRRWNWVDLRPVVGDPRAARAEMQCEIGAVESR